MKRNLLVFLFGIFGLLLSAQDNGVAYNSELPELIAWDFTMVDDVFDESENGIVDFVNNDSEYYTILLRTDSVYSFIVTSQKKNKSPYIYLRLGRKDEAIETAERLLSSFKRGKTVVVERTVLKGVSGKAYRMISPKESDIKLSLESIRDELSFLQYLNGVLSLEEWARTPNANAHFSRTSITRSGNVKTKTTE